MNELIHDATVVKANIIKDTPVKASKAVEKIEVFGEEVDPTVPEWAKQPTKPEYSSAEITHEGGSVEAAITDVKESIQQLDGDVENVKKDLSSLGLVVENNMLCVEMEG